MKFYYFLKSLILYQYKIIIKLSIVIKMKTFTLLALFGTISAVHLRDDSNANGLNGPPAQETW
jgi:hypothetical protein